jgi:predicted amidohydrolase YtcJ
MTGGTVFVGGTVVTGDGTRPVTDALAVVDGRIAALGGDALGLLRHAAERVDLAGGCLLPAFRDGHAHPLQGGLELAGVPLSDARTVADLAAAVRRHARENPTAQWIVGGGYEPALVAGGRFDRAWLDGAVADRPVLLHANDHHTAWVNSVALERAGISAATPDPPAGEIVRDADGSPLGTLRESAVALVARLVPEPSALDKLAALDEAFRRYAACGVAWVQDAAVAPRDVGVYLRLAAGGDARCRSNGALLASPRSWAAQRSEFLAARASAEREGAGQVTMRTVKFFADGVVESGTAALLEPYTDDPCSRGIANWTADELAEAATAFDADGFQLHIHAIGDAGIRTALDAVETVVRHAGPRDRRPVVAHVQLPDPADVPRFGALGVVANVEPLWLQLDACMVELTVPRLGARRSERQYPLRHLLRSGAVLSFGSDWPVSSMRPLEGLAVAVTRQTPAGEPTGGWLPGQRITVAEALAAYTTGSAYQAFDDDAGRLVAGLVHLAEDPTVVAPGDIGAITVLGTWCGGRQTYGGEG